MVDHRSKIYLLTPVSDWFRLETLDDSLQPTIDMLLNVAIFIWLGAICPWYQFAHNNVIPIYRLIPLGILILLLRRLPVVFALHKKIHQIQEVRQALFVGFFGPIGISAIFYLYVSLEFLREVTDSGVERADAEFLGEVITVVVWFLIICSVVVHGTSIAFGKLGVYLPRTISAAISSEPASPSDATTDVPDSNIEDPHLQIAQDVRCEEPTIAADLRKLRNGRRGEEKSGQSVRDGNNPGSSTASSFIPRTLQRIGIALRRDMNRDHGEAASAGKNQSTQGNLISTPSNPRPIGRVMSKRAGSEAGHGQVSDDHTPNDSPIETQEKKDEADNGESGNTQVSETNGQTWKRTVRFENGQRLH